LLTGERYTSARRALLQSWPVWVAAAIYLIVRAQTGAFGLSDAPEYYRLTFDPRLVIRNAAEYLDRGATWAAIAGVLVFLVAPRGTSLNDDERRVIRFGVVWFALMFAITVFVPIRSSLYAVAPSIGSALAAGALASRARRAAPHRFALVCTALIACVAVLIPVYRIRITGSSNPPICRRRQRPNCDEPLSKAWVFARSFWLTIGTHPSRWRMHSAHSRLTRCIYSSLRIRMSPPVTPPARSTRRAKV
jgi:hypothetical protein